MSHPAPPAPAPNESPAPSGASTPWRRAAAWLWHPARLWPVAIALTGAAFGLVATQAVTRSVEAERRGHFERHVDRVVLEVQRRLALPAQGLTGLRAVYTVMPEMGLEQLRAYVESRNLAADFPGVAGFGLVQRVSAEDLPAFVARARATDSPAFEVREAPAEGEAAVVRHIEPLILNDDIAGRDLNRIDTLRDAMQAALASGEPVLSGRVDLPLGRERRAAHVMFVPLYRHGTDPSTPSQRLRTAAGVLLAPIVEREVLSGVNAVADGRVAFELVDSQAPAGAGMDDASGSHFEAWRSFEVAGRVLKLRARDTAAFETAYSAALPRYVLAGSLLLTMVASWAVWLLAAGRERAQRLARAMTADLDRLAQVARLTSNIVIVTDAKRRITWVNDAFTRITGYSAEEALGRQPGALLQYGQTDAGEVARMRRALNAGEGVHGVLRNRNKQGREYWIEVDIQPLRDEHGALRGFIAVQSDITAQRKAADDLARERERLANIVEGTNAGVGEWDLQSGRMFLSEKWASMLGYTLAELEPVDTAKWNGLCHPEDAQAAQRALIAHLKGESTFYEHELRMRHKSGQWRWLQLRSRVTARGPDGRARWISGAHIDITDRKSAEQRWQARAALSGDWFWQTDTEHRFVELVVGDEHHAATRSSAMLGLRRDEADWIDPPEGGWAAFHAMLDRHEPFKGLCYASRAVPGQVRWVEVDGQPRLDAGGHFLGYYGVGRDVTERRQVTEHLRESLAQLRALLEAIPIPVVMKDVTGRFQRVNRAYAELVGWDAAALIGKNSHDLLEAGVADTIAAEDREVMDSGVPTRREVRLPLTDGRTLDVQLSKAPIVGTDGRTVGIVSALVDIASEKAAARALLEAKDAAEAANRAKSAFLATMSHEIRTPMNGVLGMAELLALSRLDEEQARTVESLRHSALGLLRLLDDVLDFSKIEAGRLELEREPLELTALVEGVGDALSPVALARGVALSVSVQGGLPDRRRGDATRVRQVLTNLLGNAIKFSAGREGRPGRVSLRVERGAEPAGLRFVVADNGIGIDEPALARLFAPFTQAETSTTRRFGGTGLGLAISRRLVELMGGTIEVKSRPDEGSTFTVCMELPPTDDQPNAHWPELEGVHGVIVDAGDLPVDDLIGWLRAAGAQVQRCPDPHEAAAAAQALPDPCVVVLDDHLHLSGAAQGLRQLRIGRGRRGPARLLSPTLATLDLLRRDAFLHAVALLAGRSAPDSRPVGLQPVPEGEQAAPPTREQALARNQLILVAEDDPTNREVIMRQLARLGYAADLAEDGAQALALCRQVNYALLLSDLHMPSLDGYALTEALRREEQAAGHPRMPVLALTANALKGEAVRARAAGMDDYLTKPVPLAQLQAALRQWMPAPVADSAASPPADTGTLDLAVLRTLVGDDEATLRELLAAYLAASRAQAAEVCHALAAGDTRQAGAVAHKLKSASRSVGAARLGDLCAEFERAGRRTERGDLERFARTFAAVERAIEAVLARETIA